MLVVLGDRGPVTVPVEDDESNPKSGIDVSGSPWVLTQIESGPVPETTRQSLPPHSPTQRRKRQEVYCRHVRGPSVVLPARTRAHTLFVSLLHTHPRLVDTHSLSVSQTSTPNGHSSTSVTGSSDVWRRTLLEVRRGRRNLLPQGL